MQLLNNRQFVANDHWIHIVEDELVNAESSNIWPLAQFIELNGSGELKQAHKAGVLISSEESIEQLLPIAERVALVAVKFEALRDGRGFSFARLLRRAGFTGEIRAVGEVSRDRLAYLERCGFDSVQLPEVTDAASIERAYTEISVRYQASQDLEQPIYRQGN